MDHKLHQENVQNSDINVKNHVNSMIFNIKIKFKIYKYFLKTG